MSRDAELKNINEELQGVEEELQALQRRKRELTDRRQELQEQLDAEAIDLVGDSSNVDGRKDPDWNDSFPWTADIHRLRQEAVRTRPFALLYKLVWNVLIVDVQFHIASFRSVQEQVINATLSKRDLFVVMRSGGGKSLCYQLPSMYQNVRRMCRYEIFH